MNYRDLKWGELKSFAKSQGINTKGLTKVDIYESLDSFNDEQVILKEILIEEALGDEIELHPFKGIKETHPIFKDIEPYIPYLIAYQSLNKAGEISKTVSKSVDVAKGIAEVFMNHIEIEKRAPVSVCCGNASKYYERLIVGYNKIAKEYGRSCV